MKKLMIVILAALAALVVYTAAFAAEPAEDITNVPAVTETFRDTVLLVSPTGM